MTKSEITGLKQLAEVIAARSRVLAVGNDAQVAFTDDRDANALINDIENHPHAFVLCCLMDRQMRSPPADSVWELTQRIGSTDFRFLRLQTSTRILEAMSSPTKIHRFPEIMGSIVYDALERIETVWESDASRIWEGTPSSAALVRRFLDFRGAGIKIATLAANILVRDFQIPVSDRYSIDISPDTHVRRVAWRLGWTETKDASNEEIIYRARELNPEYPGVFDFAMWEIGKKWCRPQEPECGKCYLRRRCPSSNSP